MPLMNNVTFCKLNRDRVLVVVSRYTVVVTEVSQINTVDFSAYINILYINVFSRTMNITYALNTMNCTRRTVFHDIALRVKVSTW